MCTYVVSAVSHTPQTNQARKKKSNAVKILAPSHVGSNMEIKTSNTALHVGVKFLSYFFATCAFSSIENKRVSMSSSVLLYAACYWDYFCF